MRTINDLSVVGKKNKYLEYHYGEDNYSTGGIQTNYAANELDAPPLNLKKERVKGDLSLAFWLDLIYNIVKIFEEVGE